MTLSRQKAPQAGRAVTEIVERRHKRIARTSPKCRADMGRHAPHGPPKPINNASRPRPLARQSWNQRGSSPPPRPAKSDNLCWPPAPNRQPKLKSTRAANAQSPAKAKSGKDYQDNIRPWLTKAMTSKTARKLRIKVKFVKFQPRHFKPRPRVEPFKSYYAKFKRA